MKSPLLLLPLVSAAALAQTPHEVDIAWDDPAQSITPVAGYRVYFDDTGVPGAGSANIDVGRTNGFTFPDPGLPSPTDDQYWLSVESYSQTGLRSVQAPIQIVIEFGPPAPAENVRVINVRPLPEAPAAAAPRTFRIQPEPK